MIDHDRGVVLRGIKLRETSKILSVLGSAHGRLRLVAHGGRGTGHRFGSSLEVGNEIEFVFSQRPGSELGTLREATLRRSWLAGGRKLENLGAGLAALELLERVVPEGAAEPGLLEDTFGVLAALQVAGDRATSLLAFYMFELRLLGRLGLQPDLGACARCGAVPQDGAVLDVVAGALFCRECGPAGRRRLLLPQEAAAVLARLARCDWSDLESIETQARTRRAVGLAVHRLLSVHLDRYRYPRSLQLLKNVDKRPAPPSDPESVTESS